ncbi:unnamed protein product [Cuscuta epithymum]|uniref:Late embryogenesis abundant protein LEA-2 subgroup domain-containing protein n=1 Tax=Cuscuta epithymum TaxID=186058 RepID=A0AAV0D9X6_9ASTE|nr:unnamed protein product [Cuscuta epithymum]
MGDPTRPPPVTGYPACPPNGYPPPPAGTAYPYPQPSAAYPYPQPGNYYINNTDVYMNPRRIFLRRLLLVLVACFVIAMVVGMVLWVIFRPKVPEVRVDSLSVSDFNLSSNFLSANWDLKFTVRNPTKRFSLYYDDIYASVYYGHSMLLAWTSVAPFSQDSYSETPSKATFSAASTFVDNWVVEGINKSNPNVEFDVLMLARVRFKAGSWRARGRYLRAYCRDLNVRLGNHTAHSLSSGNLVGGPKQCQVRLS